ncbi:L-arabinose transport system substrate-binding protein [Kitasatospora sp. MAA4]|uniref:substrate-binding domain-containing protein n=1 Tax=Kitasatospora sp. MAA4 TaxID=3035093 RepID=UPI002475B9F5|nr:substrate-binding domain-containing protein [Kitasatospora sp. MAA4]MDH6132575.1 L-arabinose transport system substrate-binding protein [Kitasatospora sp. MAA4]
MSTLSRGSRRTAASVGLALVLALSACSTGRSSGGSGGGLATVSGKISLTYLQKQGDQGYFVGEAAGAKARAAQLGVDLTVVNLGSDADKTVVEAKAALARKTNGLIVVVPDPAVGPQLAQVAGDAKVPLLSTDDQFCATSPYPSNCDASELVPRIGFSGPQLGAAVGKRAAAEYGKADWDEGTTRIVSAWEPDVTVCSDRISAAKDAFLTAAGASIQKIDLPTDNSVAGAQAKMAATISANPAVRHWIVWGCNDENVQGAVTALQNAGFGAGDVIGIGLGGYLACKDWASGRPSGMRAALFINGGDVGALAVQTMVDRLRGGRPFPAQAFAPTTMVDASDWRNSALQCS